MTGDFEPGEARFDWAISSGWLSRPQFQTMPAGFPFEVAVVAVGLPAGCRPPHNALGHRIAVGTGASRSTAAAKALFEGAERYSLQFHTEMDETFGPLFTVAGPAEVVPAAELALGAPLASRLVTTEGAASGASLESACMRAVLELLERHHIAELNSATSELASVDISEFTDLVPMVAWLKGQLRVLDLRVGCFPEGYCVAAVRCSDPNGGRSTTGSAAGIDLFDTLNHGVEEAVLHWRNMVALEYRAVDVGVLSGADRELFCSYRGATASPHWPQSTLRSLCSLSVADIDPQIQDLMAILAKKTGKRVRLFDMTRLETGAFTAKCFVG